MKKLEQIYEGKAKKVFATDDPDVVIVDYKDDATAFNGIKKGSIAGKGVINNRMSNHMMRKLEAEGIPTHLIEELSEREEGLHRAPGRHRPQHLRRLLRQALWRGRGHRL